MPQSLLLLETILTSTRAPCSSHQGIIWGVCALQPADMRGRDGGGLRETPVLAEWTFVETTICF